MVMWLCRSCTGRSSFEGYWNFFYPRRDAKGREKHLVLSREGTQRGAENTFL